MATNTKLALVTGGNRGIGYELVKQLASKNFKVIFTCRDHKTGHEITESLNKSDLNATYLVLDLNNQDSIHQAAITVKEQYGRLDVLINNAGIYLDDNKRLVDMEPLTLEKTLETNFFGVYHVIRSFLPLMEKQGYGRIINVSSEYGEMSQMSYPGIGAYKLSKFALNGLTQLLASEVKGNIKINAVDPGWVSTDMGGPTAPTTPQQAAESFIWLASIGSDGPNGKFFRGRTQIDW
ncbi:SDR family NAD(P)-dependent oxidoreductase [Niallia circulans]|uniref:SDR family NAD(P)-dependent oxidoreductase n=1 Tax=Niallia circulans TaxID=1397 RepID=A0A553SR75_NIACI|nr:SDR family NAD(P)-dependent oxidoreductase [Niallia circulans]TRZ39461.1 SDR family NAD(P)-dependent oxidoreductase [Niallia circulans]